jgi:hypothetical protein
MAQIKEKKAGYMYEHTYVGNIYQGLSDDQIDCGRFQ